MIKTPGKVSRSYLIFLKIVISFSILQTTDKIYGYQMRLPYPESVMLNPNDDACSSLVEVDPKTLTWPYPGTPPWYAEPETKVYNNSVVTGLVNTLRSEIVPGLSITFGQIFNLFEKAGCLMYIHGGCVRDFFLGISPKDIDVEYSCEPCKLYQTCIDTFGEDMCYISDSYFNVGEIVSTSPFEELEGVNWNGTIFAPPYTKEYTTNGISFDLNGNDIIIDIVGSSAQDTCSHLIRIPVPESQWQEWMEESVYYHNNGLQKLPRFWKLRTAPKSYLPADNATLLFIKSNVEQLWKNPTSDMEEIFRRFYCGVVRGNIAHNGSGCYVKKTPDPSTVSKLAAFNDALEEDMGTQWYNSSVVDENVNKIIVLQNITQISNCEELQGISQNLNGDYLITGDIDCSNSTNWNNGSGFIPIGRHSQPFNGTLYGDSHLISNLYINRPKENFVGLFGCTKNTDLSNIGLVNVNITGATILGPLVGQSSTNTNIENCYATGKIKGSTSIGGLIGSALSSSITNSHSKVNIEYERRYPERDYAFGGLIGLSDGQTSITNSHATGNIKGCSSTGGLVGLIILNINQTSSFYLSKSYATGDVEGSDYVGGLVGVTSSGNDKIEKSFSSGNVYGTASNGAIGGLVGYALGKGTYISDSYSSSDVETIGELTTTGGLVGANYANIINSYSKGKVTTPENPHRNIGGLLGWNSALNIINSYYDMDTSGQKDTGKGEPKSTKEMMEKSTYSNWDFNSTWKIESSKNNYPHLEWQEEKCIN